MIKGIKASGGIALGRAHVIKELSFEFEERSNNAEEVSRYHDAKQGNILRLEQLKEKTLNEIGESEAEVFEAHKQLLLDPVMDKEINELLINGYTSEYAFSVVMDKYIEMFQGLDNDYMRERAADLKDIKVNMLKTLSGMEVSDVIDEKVIIVTYDLTPSETVNLDKEKTIGFVTEIGGETSHSAIIARTLNIPAVVGCGKLKINENDFLILDGEQGLVYVNPDNDLIKKYQEQLEVLKSEALILEKYKNQQSITKDKKIIEIAGNIANVDDVEYVLEATGDGIGLFRSEFLYMNRSTLPSEDDQFEAYKIVLERMGEKPVTIRTMDIGGDKKLDYLDLEEEMNPFLGYRAIRICLKDKSIFKTQLRALLRSSAYGKLRIMFPMIGSLEELLEAKAILNEVENKLIEEEYVIGDYQVGIMIEIPSAALIADILSEHVDFFSIGTNDLIQYTTAVDRMNQTIAELYSPYHPAFIRLLKQIVDAGHSNGIEVGMCGNVAGHEEFIPYLLDIGLDELSMSPNMILKARSIVNNHRVDTHRVEELLRCKTKEEVKEALKSSF